VVKNLIVPAAWLLAMFATSAGGQQSDSMRAPAVPLIAHDPYFSVWSMADRLTDEGTLHWTGKANSLYALLRVDGNTYRVLGRARFEGIPTLDQTSSKVLPTRTICTFAGGGIQLGLTFFTPALPHDLDILARPVTYLDWTVSSADGKTHVVQFYFDAGSDLVVNTADQPVSWSRLLLDGKPVLRIGSREQRILAKRGDDLRIDWGYLYVTADRLDHVDAVATTTGEARNAFRQQGRLPDSDDFSTPVPGRRGTDEVLSLAFDMGKVGTQPVSRFLMIGYDDLYSIEYFDRRLRPWWRRNGAEMSDVLRLAQREHDALLARGTKFDEELMADLRRVGGAEYAILAALAYRQTLAAHKLAASQDGTPMLFPKENFSNGCISTVDVIYPSSPFTLLFNPLLLRAQLDPVLEYASMARWPWRYAPHDLGTYPMADGQVYGGGERSEGTQMPVEETGNMLIMMAAVAKVEGNATYAEKHWPLLEKWAAYLKEKGLDPEDQLSTDDFAGHLAHNANLSIKAILALGAFGQLCAQTGRKQEGEAYREVAREFAGKWVRLAQDGDHYRLAFDKPGSWSMKYNLVWDKLLRLDLFPAEVARTETAFYLSKLNRYGLPLDYRKDYTKVDWTVWSAALADSPADFRKLISPMFRWVNETPNRVPLADWYDTVTGKQQSILQARSVVGGVFIKVLEDGELWKKYSTESK
jgi:hypothetical protein